MTNSMLLLTHSVAALSGHEGPARNDAPRPPARRAARHRRAVRDHARPARARRTRPGFVNSMTPRSGGQHLVFDAEVVDGLVYAYKARARARSCRTRRSRKLRNAIHNTARGSFWRYPTIRLNQINWYALMYAADHTVTGDPTLLKRDLRAPAAALRRAARHGELRPGHALPLPAARARSTTR